jgi:hypothetical protein
MRIRQQHRRKPICACYLDESAAPPIPIPSILFPPLIAAVSRRRFRPLLRSLRREVGDDCVEQRKSRRGHPQPAVGRGLDEAVHGEVGDLPGRGRRRAPRACRQHGALRTVCPLRW